MVDETTETEILLSQDSLSKEKAIHQPKEINFHETYPSNLYWVVDNLANSDRENADPRYRNWWEAEVGLDDHDASKLQQFRDAQDQIIKSPEDWEKFHQLIFSEDNTTIERQEQVLIQQYGDNGQKLADTLKHFDPKFANHYKSSKEFFVLVQEEIDKKELTQVVRNFKNFLGLYTTFAPDQQVYSLWAPPGDEIGFSQAIKPNLVLSTLKEGSDPTHEAGAVVHEVLHNQFDPYSPPISDELSKRGVLPQDFSEGIAYAIHYGIIEEDILGNKGKLASSLEDEGRTNKKQVQFAIKLFPRIKDYIGKGRVLDDEFFDYASKSYKEIAEGR